MNIALFFTYDMSLNDWDKVGILKREIHFYNEMASKHSINYTFITYGLAEDYKYQSNLKNIKIIPIYESEKRFNNKYMRFVYSLVLPFKLKNQLKHIDIIKTNQLMGSWIPIILKLITGKPLIVRTGYDVLKFSINEKKGVHKNVFYYLLTQISLFFSDAYLVSSDGDKKFLMKNFFSNKSKIKIFNNWVNDYEKNKNKNKNKNKILAVGRLEEQKNYKNLIINLQNSPLELDIVGYGTQREELSNLAKEYNVKTNFLNTLSHSDLIDLYKEYSFYIIFSHFEGHPKSLIEAMSCGCIPIALNSEYIHEIIVDSTNGLILNSDQEKIERKIDLLNSNDEFFKEISNNAFRFTQDNYSLKKLLKRELELYKELCS